eukprot:gene16654-biopygen5057
MFQNVESPGDTPEAPRRHPADTPETLRVGTLPVPGGLERLGRSATESLREALIDRAAGLAVGQPARMIDHQRDPLDLFPDRAGKRSPQRRGAPAWGHEAAGDAEALAATFLYEKALPRPPAEAHCRAAPGTSKQWADHDVCGHCAVDEIRDATTLTSGGKVNSSTRSAGAVRRPAVACGDHSGPATAPARHAVDNHSEFAPDWTRVRRKCSVTPNVRQAEPPGSATAPRRQTRASPGGRVMPHAPVRVLPPPHSSFPSVPSSRGRPARRAWAGRHRAQEIDPHGMASHPCGPRSAEHLTFRSGSAVRIGRKATGPGPGRACPGHKWTGP